MWAMFTDPQRLHFPAGRGFSATLGDFAGKAYRVFGEVAPSFLNTLAEVFLQLGAT